MEKYCVFCGNKPSGKNKEHVIPKWLIKMTGEEGRSAYWGFDYQDLFNENQTAVKHREYPFLSFTFPACEKCNTIYGKSLEIKAQGVIKRIMRDEPLNEHELMLLLDWFDKVRIGMWLGYLYYNKDIAVKPKFHISSRIGKTDRALFVCRSAEKKTGLNFFGPGTQLFSNIPVYFGMRIDQYYFLNISTDNLVLEGLGFPNPKIDEMDPDGNFGFSIMNEGTGSVAPDLLRQLNGLKTDIAVVQPIYNKFLGYDEFKQDYVIENSADANAGVGNLFVLKDGKFARMGSDTYCLKPKLDSVSQSALMRMLTIKVSKMLISHAEKTVESLNCDTGMEKSIQELQHGILYEKWIMGRRLKSMEREMI